MEIEKKYSRQRRHTLIVKEHEKSVAFKAKIPLCMNNIEKGKLAQFSTLEEIVETNQSLLSDVASAIHLQQLLKIFDFYRKFGNS